MALKTQINKLGVVHTCNLSTAQAEAGGASILDHSGLQGKTLLKNSSKNKPQTKPKSNTKWIVFTKLYTALHLDYKKSNGMKAQVALELRLLLSGLPGSCLSAGYASSVK